MNQISLDAKGGQFLADLANWQLHLNRSTVCRTLQRARERLYACLRYTL